MKFTLHELLNQHKIVIPQIQRDYAQGRETESDLRKNFVGKIKQSLYPNSNSLNLDFVYGYTDKLNKEETIFIPLDGQQRLTTLWLIHWYLAPRQTTELNGEEANHLTEEAKSFLCGFTYETRISSKRFCDNLITQALSNSENESLSQIIKDASWFMASWNNDPTIASMLNMIDTIHEEKFDKTEAWKQLLKNKKITFDYIDIKSEEFKLTDELYIKMNSRGKPLTPFENFKAQFSGLLSSKDTDYIKEKLAYQNTSVTYQQYFAFKIDSVWMDLFWSYRDKVDTSIDDCFLNYIYFVAEFLFFKNNPTATSADVKLDFEFLNKIFSVKKNIDFLFNSFDFLSELKDIEAFFNELFKGLSNFDNSSKDYFLRAITNSSFDVRDKVILYSVLSYCIAKKINTADDSLKSFIRLIRNQLLAVRQPNQTKRIEFTSNLRLPSVSDYCKFIDGFLNLIVATKQKTVYQIFASNDLSGFTKENIGIEKAKAELINANPTLVKSIFAVEEHPFIQGNTANFKLNSKDAAKKIDSFLSIWSSEVENSLIIRAFLTVGDYSVITHSYSSLDDIWYFGSIGYWNRILTANDKTEREKVSETLDLFLLSYGIAIGNSAAEKLQFIIDNYKSKTKDWQYYFIKYKTITDNPYIKLNVFTWQDSEGFDINHLGNSGNQPLHSYHLNPYLIVLHQLINMNDKVKLHYGRFTDTSYLNIQDKVIIKCVKQGWRISQLENFTINKKLISKYNLTVDGDFLILNETEQFDRIEIAIELIKELIK